MARAQERHITRAISSVLPDNRIRSLAHEVGAVKRERKLDIVHFVQAVVLGFSSARTRTLSGLRRAYLLLSGQTLARSSFHARFNAPLVQLLRRLLDEVLSPEKQGEKLAGILSPFREVLAIDSCLVKLDPRLDDQFPGVWQKASAKITMVTNVVGRKPRSMRISAGSRADIHLFDAGIPLRNRLLIFDLGFYSVRVFDRLLQKNASFLSRIRKAGNPTVVRSLRKEHLWIEGKKLRENQEQMKGDYFDVLVDLPTTRRDHSRHVLRLRVIGVYNRTTNAWHRYITNLSPEKLSAQHVSALYSARWEIELLFRELKSDFRINQLPSSNQYATRALLLAAALALVVSRRLHDLVRKKARLKCEQIPKDRWTRVFIAHLSPILSILAAPSATLERRLLQVMCAEAPDPNVNRILLPQRVRQGTM